MAGGLLLAVLLVLIAVLVFADSGLDLGSDGGFISVMLLFGFTPAVLGGCLGGTSGSLLARERYKHAAVPITALIVVAAVVSFIG